MVVRIVLFSDGTGNSSASQFKTNVWRIYDALDLSPDANQMAFYDDGVGSSSNKYIAAATGAVGIGLKRNVVDIYKFLSRQYARAMRDLQDEYGENVPHEALPKISCFGFSRGAFTIRVLLGLIQTQGLLTRAGEEELDWFAHRAYAAFRAEAFHTTLRVEALYLKPYNWIASLYGKWKRFSPYDPRKNLHAEGSKWLQPGRPAVTIEFLGLWDTVGAYGMPFEEFRVAVDKWIFPLTFTDTNLCRFVKLSRQALSIDDERDAFTPIPFHDAPQRAAAREAREKFVGEDKSEEEAYAQIHERSIQLWFAGVHANVGGGYPDDSLAYAPLNWILSQGVENGAIICRKRAIEEIEKKATAFGTMHDSRAGFGGFYRYKPRDIAGVLKPNATTVAPCNVTDDDYLPLIHKSALRRIAAACDGYAPIALPTKFAVADDNGRVLHVVDFLLTTAQRQAAIAASAWPDPALKVLPAPTKEQRGLVDTAVFWRRVVYQTTIWPLLALFLVFPLLKEHAVDETSLFGALFKLAGGFLPDFAHTWIKAFRTYPGWAFLLFLIVGASFVWGGTLKTRIGDRSRVAWANGNVAPRQTWLGRNIFDPIARWILNCDVLEKAWSFWALTVFPLSIAAPIAVLLVGALAYATLQIPGFADRLVFETRSSLGLVCEGGPNKPAVELTGSKSFVFDLSNPCAPSGLKLKQDQRYRATLEMVDGKWLDGAYEADLAGLKWNNLGIGSKLFYLTMTPSFRRVLTEPWFKPIFRIGETGHFQLPVNPDPSSAADESHRKLTMTFDAPADGELFVFVNDAYTGVFPIGWFASGWPPSLAGPVLHTYGNNAGQGRVTIEEVAGEEDARQKPSAQE